jgi:hypothetical protein
MKIHDSARKNLLRERLDHQSVHRDRQDSRLTERDVLDRYRVAVYHPPFDGVNTGSLQRRRSTSGHSAESSCKGDLSRRGERDIKATHRYVRPPRQHGVRASTAPRLHPLAASASKSEIETRRKSPLARTLSTSRVGMSEKQWASTRRQCRYRLEQVLRR